MKRVTRGSLVSPGAPLSLGPTNRFHVRVVPGGPTSRQGAVYREIVVGVAFILAPRCPRVTRRREPGKPVRREKGLAENKQEKKCSVFLRREEEL